MRTPGPNRVRAGTVAAGRAQTGDETGAGWQHTGHNATKQFVGPLLSFTACWGEWPVGCQLVFCSLFGHWRLRPAGRQPTPFLTAFWPLRAGLLEQYGHWGCQPAP